MDEQESLRIGEAIGTAEEILRELLAEVPGQFHPLIHEALKSLDSIFAPAPRS